MPADSDEAAQHLHHAEFGADIGVGPRRAVGIDARNHFGRHGVGDDVLDHGADHDQQRAQHVEPIGRQEREPCRRRRPQA